MVQLKPINSTQVRIPEQLEVLVGTQIDILPYPIYGTPADKLVYLQLMRELNIVSETDESIIR